MLHFSRAGLTNIACGLWFNKYKVMRPADKWNKKPAQARKRKTKTEADPAGPSEAQSDFPQSDYPQSDFYCDQPSVEPISQNTRGDSTEPSEAPITANHARANSEQPSQKPSETRNQWMNTDLDAALNRAIQSSPGGRNIMGTQESPIDLAADDLSPQPTRRLLFPSPRNNRETQSNHKTLDNAALPGSKPQSTTIIETAFVEDPSLGGPDKENMAPMGDEDLAHLFECSPGIFHTPARKANSPRKTPRIGSGSNTFEDLLKTPTPNRSSLKTLSSNARHAFTPRTCGNNATSGISAFLPTFSPAEKQNLCPLTPSRFANLSSPGGTSLNRGEMTPFTRQLTQLLSTAGNGTSPGRPFDFGDMSAFGMSPGGRGAIDFDKMEFSVHDFESMDFGDPTKVDDDAGVVLHVEQDAVTTSIEEEASMEQ